MFLNGAYVNIENNHRDTALHHTIKEKQFNAAKLLISSQGIDVNVTDDDGMTPIYLATEKGFLDIVQYLLSNGACTDLPCTSNWKNGYTFLHLAAESGNKEILSLLLCDGANVNSKAINSLTPLHLAAEKKHLRIVELLLDYGAFIDCTDTSALRYGSTPLHFAVENGYAKIVEFLVKKGANVNVKPRGNDTLLFMAAKIGHLAIVQYFLKHGAHINGTCVDEGKTGYTPLHIACKNNHKDVVEQLRSEGADSNLIAKDNLTNKREEIVKLLIIYGADVNAKDRIGKPVLFYAIENYNLKIVKLLVKSRIKIDNVDKHNRTALHVACKNVRSPIVRLLLQFNFDVNRTCKKNYTPLDYATLARNFFPPHNLVWRRLNEFQKKCQKELENMKNENIGIILPMEEYYRMEAFQGINIIIERVDRGNEKIVELLLKNNADPSLETHHFETPLICAITKENLPIIELLLAYGANVNSINS
ncbi:putative ankyrin repeat protein RF_0381 [Microplitis demolitor]|uniref:putative ankyrin repeat protein RF_0381 n=1 Tax=Microplitis demolitor TaxID=69319 RepID=UPI00235B6714|nr:putative ankyrin repeat protein RF_0381 [Microplitis demolitor]